MKRTLTTILTAIIMIGTFSAFAAAANNPLKDSKSNKVLESYLEAITAGNADFNKFLFAPEFEYRNSVNGGITYRREYLNFLKATKDLKYNCKSSISILDECGKECVAKLTMVFDTFTRVDHISLTQSKDGWKIYKVVTTYP